MRKIDKHYVSEIDKKVDEFNQTHERSPAQQAEYEKYQAIYQKRDVQEGTPQTDDDHLWG